MVLTCVAALAFFRNNQSVELGSFSALVLFEIILLYAIRLRCIMKIKDLLLTLVITSFISSALAEKTCRTDSFGTTRCSDGTTYRTDSFGTTRDNNGRSWRTDSFGTIRGSDGSTYRKDSFGTARDNEGNSWRADSFGTTRGSNGTICSTDSFGTMRCN